MCEKCNNTHVIGKRCTCSCHDVVDRIIVERDLRGEK